MIHGQYVFKSYLYTPKNGYLIRIAENKNGKDCMYTNLTLGRDSKGLLVRGYRNSSYDSWMTYIDSINNLEYYLAKSLKEVNEIKENHKMLTELKK